MRQKLVLGPTADHRKRFTVLGEPLLHERNGWQPVRTQSGGIFRAVGQRHRGIEAHEFHARSSELLKHRGIRGGRALKCAKEPVYVQRLAIWAVRRQPWPKAKCLDEVQKIEQKGRLVVAGKGILHDHDTARALSFAQRTQALRCRGSDAALLEFAVDVHARQFRRPDETDRLQGGVARAASERIGKPRRPRHPGHEVLDRGHHIVPHGAQIAAVVELEELGAESGHVDLDRALPDAGLARETPVQRLLDLVGEVGLAAAVGPRVVNAGRQRAPARGGAQTPALRDRVDALQG